MNWELFIELFRSALRRISMQNRYDDLTIEFQPVLEWKN